MSETKEIKFKMHKTKKFFVKNRLVLHFNNIGKSFLSMYLYKNENLDMFETYFFEEHEIVNGLPVNINKISDIIRSFVVKVDSIQLAISTNDALAGASKNIGALLNFKNIYFIPYKQDDAENKPTSVIADFSLTEKAMLAALQGKQLQPIIL